MLNIITAQPEANYIIKPSTKGIIIENTLGFHHRISVYDGSKLVASDIITPLDRRLFPFEVKRKSDVKNYRVKAEYDYASFQMDLKLIKFLAERKQEKEALKKAVIAGFDEYFTGGKISQIQAMATRLTLDSL